MSLQERQPQTTTLQGYTRAKYLTDDQLGQILDAMASGTDAVTACLEAGTSHTQFRKRYKSDPDLEGRVIAARAEGDSEFNEIIRHELRWHALVKKDYKALRDLAMIHLPEWDIMRTQRFEHAHTGTVDIEHRLAEYTKEELETIRRLELEKVGELPVIEQQSSAA